MRIPKGMKLTHLHCVNCLEELKCVPVYETVKAWEERTGKQYPDTAPVWLIQRDNPMDRYALWHYGHLKKLLAADSDWLCIVATEVGAPPDNWRPEEAGGNDAIH
jgi:hypothetical protein